MSKGRMLAYAGLAVLAVVLFHWAYSVLGPATVYLVAQSFVGMVATLFCVVYHWSAPWWSSVMGRNIMLLVGSIALILDLGLVFNLLGRPEWMREVFAIVFLAIGVAILRRLVILIDVQHHTPDHPGTARRNH